MQLRTEIEIDRDREHVWRALVDFSTYPDWNPFIKSVEGPLAPGEHQTLTLTTTDGEQLVLRSEVLEVDAPHKLRWRDQLWFRGLLDGEHFIELVPLEGSRTRVIHGEDFKGLLLQYMGKRLTATARGFVGMNEALKRRAERGG